MKLNKRLIVLVFCALLAAMTVIFKELSINISDWLRFSLENTPILLAGILFGPVAGMMTGAVGDIVGCIYCGFGINPMITVGAALIGGVSGLVFCLAKKLPALPRLTLSIYSGHIIGSMIVKSIAMHIWFGRQWAELAFRIPTYIIIGAAEILLIRLLMKNKAFIGQLNRITGKNRKKEAKQ